MKKLTFIFSIALAAIVFISFNTEENHKTKQSNAITELFSDIVTPFEEVLKNQAEVVVLDPSDINVIEIEEDVDLGLDVAAYLPIGFDAYKGFQWDLADLNVIELEEEVELGFDVKKYLPANFNPYKI